MGNKIVKARIKGMRDTDTNWEKSDPILLNGETIIVDTTNGETRYKIGDGTSKYSELPFYDEGSKGGKSLIDEDAANMITADADNITINPDGYSMDVISMGNSGISVRLGADAPTTIDSSGITVGNFDCLDTGYDVTLKGHKVDLNGNIQYVHKLSEKANSTDLGDISNLTTDDKTSIVNAINELEVKIETAEITDVYDLSTAVNELQTGIGDISTLNVLSYKNLVDAINNTYSRKVDKIFGMQLSENDYSTNEKNKVATIGAVADLTTDEKTTVVGALNELNESKLDKMSFEDFASSKSVTTTVTDEIDNTDLYNSGMNFYDFYASENPTVIGLYAYGYDGKLKVNGNSITIKTERDETAVNLLDYVDESGYLQAASENAVIWYIDKEIVTEFATTQDTSAIETELSNKLDNKLDKDTAITFKNASTGESATYNETIKMSTWATTTINSTLISVSGSVESQIDASSGITVNAQNPMYDGDIILKKIDSSTLETTTHKLSQKANQADVDAIPKIFEEDGELFVNVGDKKYKLTATEA